MSYASFQELHRLLQPVLITIHKDAMAKATAERRQKRRLRGHRNRSFRTKWNRYVPNGIIHTTVRLAIALRFFAGGSMYDIAPLYGVSRADAFGSVWMVVEAVHRTQALKLVFPEDHDQQRQLAREFARQSQAGFDCCVGAVDGILIWILQPSASCCRESRCDATKFFCGRKHKFSLNCQAVANCRGKFLPVDMSIRYPASTSDCLAFESSALYGKLTSGILAEGLCLFGDNAYLNSPFLATPYPNVSPGYKDAYNFFHSQLRIRVECAFGMFVQRWGILRSAMPQGITLRKTTAIVLALAKLHNYCIDQKDTDIRPMTASDELTLMSHAVGSVTLEDGNGGEVPAVEYGIPRQLMGSGEHFDDVPRETREIRRRGFRDIDYRGNDLPRITLVKITTSDRDRGGRFMRDWLETRED